MLRKTAITTHKKKKILKAKQQQQQQKQQLSHPPFHAIIEDTITDNISQMACKSKAYIADLLATIIK